MTEKMKTVCVGRFLVDVPAQAEVTLSREMMDGFEIVTAEESEAEFQDRVMKREAEIIARGPGTVADGKGGMVYARDLRVPGMVGRALVYGRDSTYGFEKGQRVDAEWVSVEVYARRDGLSVSLIMKYADEDKVNAAEALLARLQPRGENEIPAVPGFCIWRAVFAEPLPPHETEHIAMHIGMPDHPDLGMAFASLPGGGSDGGLLARVADNDASAGADEMLRVTKLRDGRRSINGVNGEEVLERVREFNFTTTFGFMWEAQGVKDDPLQPFLSFELQAGISPHPGAKPLDSSLHEDAVLALWDTISSSIRMRPNGPPPPGAAAPEPPSPRLGAIANAGDVCPQSGWWQCNEGGQGIDVHGGRVQYIRKGERMPQALLLPRQTLWQKVRRIQPSEESPRLTAWTLVDKRQRPRTTVTVTVALAQAGMPAAAPGPGAPTPVALGACSRTGEACPASGWWRCEETHALDGTRWFARGSLLPVATFQVPPKVFGRTAGPEVIQRRSMWHLVRQVEAATLAQAVPATVLPERRQTLDEPPTLA